MRPRPIRRVFIAGGSILARRVMRTAREAGIESVVLIRDADAEAAWPDEADYAVYLPDKGEGAWPSAEHVVEAAVDAGCDAVHPGWGLLARNPMLTERMTAAGLTGASPNTIQLAAVADRSILRHLAEQLEVPTVPGSDPIEDASMAETWLVWTGLPAIVKSVDEVSGLRAARIGDGAEGRATLRRFLAAGPVVLERLVVGAREIEVPVVGDGEGGIITLGDCDLTSRVGGERALIEVPAAGLSDECRAEVRAYAVEVAQHLQWLGLGSARFLVTPDGRPYFLQFRPGLQPWHAALELVYGIDLVDVQLRLAAGDELGWDEDDLRPGGQALCVRLVVRDSRGEVRLDRLSWPEDVRLDTGPAEGEVVLPGDEVGILSVLAPTRQAAIVRLKSAIDELVVEGPSVGLAGIRRLIDCPGFWRGPLDRDAVAALLSAPAPSIGG